MKDLNNNFYKRCSKCVMDTTDKYIIFDENGICNHCKSFADLYSKTCFHNKEGNYKLELVVKKIKKFGMRNKYDSILGLSGGLDSTYAALKAFELGLNPLVIHIDAGWNSELAVSNIEALVKYCNYDLYTHVVNWEDMKNLQLAYLKAGVSNQDVPQDHIFLTSIYKFAARNNIKFIISGGNTATEGIFPESWLWSNIDSINLKDIYNSFCKRKFINYETTNLFQYYFWYPFIKRIRVIRLLNYMQYNKSKALKELSEKIDFKPYERKHGESIFTSFYQNYYLPEKYGFDKRLPHFSSLINSNQLTRKKALELLELPLYEQKKLDFEKDYIAKKLGITTLELNKLISSKSKSHKSFKNFSKFIYILNKIRSILKIFFKGINIY